MAMMFNTVDVFGRDSLVQMTPAGQRCPVFSVCLQGAAALYAQAFVPLSREIPLKTQIDGGDK